uniref:Replication restart protein PriA n=1 Tax=Thermorudis peleae TaxID=1382356 RepID=A0A831TG10_9BACT
MSYPASPLLVDVAADVPTVERRRLLTYAVPEHLIGQIEERQLVWVPVRDELKLAVVVRCHRELPSFPVRPLYAPVEPAFRLYPWQWEVAEWLCDETVCSLFEAVSPFLPPGISGHTVEVLRLRPGMPDAAPRLTSVQRALVDLLAERGEMTLEAARRALGRRLTTVVERLVAAGVIERAARVRPWSGPAATQRFVRLGPEAGNGLTPEQREALRRVQLLLARREGAPVPWDMLRREGVTASLLSRLAERGAIEILELPRLPAALAPQGSPVDLDLTPEQIRAWNHIRDALRGQRSQVFLLHGVTGSGKTELYLRATAECLREGRQAIVLVPEIALATQVLSRFAARFPGQVVFLHSALSGSERIAAWQAVARGQAPVVLGPRSALFAPVSRLGLVVIDEEHEAAYKQDAPPRYHARAVARQLVSRHDAVLLLGSATPDVSSAYACDQGEVIWLELRERVGPRVVRSDGQVERAPLLLPLVEIVDMRLELQRGNLGLFSQALLQALSEALAAGEQAILLLNRRGLATVVQCRACGHVESCPFCDVPLVYHADRSLLICHRCNLRRPPPSTCPACNSRAVSYYGAGTQRVERDIRRIFPEARVTRWDQDVARRGLDPAELVRRARRHEVDIIIGTQMIAKGFDFPLVSTIGVINADTQLYLPDYRAGERTFQLLTQVAGRAGRRSPGGRVIVQTYTPDHYAIQAASRHDYQAFYREELAFRRRHGYPPFRRLVRLLYRHSDDLACQIAAESMAERLRAEATRLALGDVEVLGPTPAFISRLRGRYQWQILLRGSDAQRLAAACAIDPGWVVDVDPISLL